MKVYVITAGDYSDYHIIGVTADKKVAEKYCGLRSGYDEYGFGFSPRIEEYDTDFLSYGADPNYKCYRVTATNGIFKAEEYDSGFEYPEDLGAVNAFKRKDGVHRAVTYCISKSEEQAIKIAQDRMARYKAAKANII